MRSIKALTFLLIVFCAGCAKKGINDTLVPVGGINSPASSIRLFNFYGFPLDITVNNIPLTSYGSSGSGVGQGLSLLPSGVWGYGSSFTIPTTLLDKNGIAKISVQVRGTPVANFPTLKPSDTSMPNNPLQPVDYYLLADGHYHPIPRAITGPPQPSSFRVRVINMAARTDDNGLAGPVTVTYADGSPVDPRLSNIATGASSDYVDMPYGAYEFKIFVNNDHTRQMTEQPARPNSRADAYGGGFIHYQDQEARFTPVRVFKAGGFYTIFISQNLYDYSDNYGGPPEGGPIWLFENGYRIITENSPPVNSTYAEIQGVNVCPVDGILTMKIDGQALGQPLGYGQHTDYSILVKGTHTVEVDDASGKKLVQKDITLYPYDNISAWAYMKNDTPDICFSATDMSTVATNIQLKFLNLCSGLPYLTFTNDVSLFTNNTTTNGIDSATNNIPLGVPVYTTPYERWPRDLSGGKVGASVEPMSNPFSLKLRAFQSDIGPPVILPGSFLDQVTPLTEQVFIANPDLYASGFYTPAPPEPGAYTIALIGKLQAQKGDPFAPRIFVLKHNK